MPQWRTVLIFLLCGRHPRCLTNRRTLLLQYSFFPVLLHSFLFSLLVYTKSFLFVLEMVSLTNAKLPKQTLDMIHFNYLISNLSACEHHGKNEYDFQANCLFQRHMLSTHVKQYILKVPSHPIWLHFQQWIVYALWGISHCGIAVMVTRFRIIKRQLSVRDTQWDFNRVHCSDRLVSQWSNKGGLNCGCCWQLERGIWYMVSS